MRALHETTVRQRLTSLILTGIVLALGGGAALSQAQETKPTQPPTTPPKNEAPVKLEDRKFRFNFRGSPWPTVFDWLTKETGIPVISPYKVSNTCTVFVPEGVEYTLGQTIDLLNEALTGEKYILIRRERSFTLLPADEKLDLSQISRVNPEELEKRGASEIVTTVFDLKGLVAGEIQAELKPMMSKFGEITALTQANQLVLTDTVGSLRLIRKTLRDIEQRDTGAGGIFIHTCQYCKARDLERLLKDSLGGMPAQQPQEPPRFGFDPRFAPPAPVVPNRRQHYIAADEGKNMVFVTGPADILAKAKDITEKFDKPKDGQQKVLVGDPKFMMFEVGSGKAEAISKTLGEVYKGSSTIRISTAGTGTILVFAYPDDLFEITRRIKEATEGGNETKLIPAGSQDADKLATILKDMFGASTSGAPFIAAQPEQSAIAVRGTSEQVAQVAKAIEVLSGGGLGGTGSNMRVITLERGSAATLADALERMMGQMRSNPIKVVAPGREVRPPTPPMPRTNEQPKTDPPKKTHLDLRGSDLQFVHATESPLVDPQAAQPKKTELPGNPTKPLNIAAFGNKLILSSEDGDAMNLAAELVRLFVQSNANEADFEVIRLQTANATDAARILDEAFNGRRVTQQPQNGMAQFFGRFGGQGAQPPSDPRPDRIRVVADPGANALLVRANPLDLLTVRRLLEKAIDSSLDSPAMIKTWYIGPLKNAAATEVAAVLRDVYQEQMNQTPRETNLGGLRGLAFSGLAREGSAERGSRKVTLTLGVDDRTNSLLVSCSEIMKNDIERLVMEMETAAQKATRTIKIIPLQGVDPTIVQQAIEAVQGRKQPATTPRPDRPVLPGMSPGNGQGATGFPDRRRSGLDRRGPDFFDSRDTDVPSQQPALLVDPQSSNTSSSTARPTPGSKLALVAYEEEQQPIVPQDSVTAPRRDVTAQALPELGIVVLRAENPEDAQAILELIEYIKKIGAKAEVDIQLFELKYADATSVIATLNQLFQRVNVGPGGNSVTLNSPTTTNIGALSISTSQSASVALIPLPRFNAILVATSKARMPDVKKEIDRLDRLTTKSAQPTPFPLKKAAASRVSQLITSFWANRYPGESQNQIRVTFEDTTNTVFVQAAPADLAEIRQLIYRIDNTVSSAVNDLRIVPLRNALSTELGALLLQALSEGIVTSSATGTGAGLGGALGGQGGGLFGGQGGGLFGGQGGGLFGGQGGGLGGQGLGGGQGGLGGLGGQQARPGGVAGGTGGSGTVSTKTVALRFISRQGGSVLSGKLEDISITPDARTNSLILSAPEETMKLLLTLINELDVAPAARAEINIFPLKKADANTLAATVQQLFLGTATGIGGQQFGGQVGGLGGLGGLGGAQGGQLRTTSSEPLVVPLRLAVDARTNSIIAAGSPADLIRLESIVTVLEDAPQIAERKNEVFALRNAPAVDVANALSSFLTSQLQVLQLGAQLAAYQQLEREVVVVAEPITNKLLISSTPRYYEEVVRLIRELDADQPMVVIQVLIAEVDLTDSEEFGVEIGLQSPVLFQRSLDANGVTVNGTGLVGATNTIGQLGFNFNNPTLPLGNSVNAGQGIVGFQGLGNFGTGRVSPNNGIGGFVFSAANDTFNLLVRALKTQGRIDILSRPQIMTQDNQFASILVGQQVPTIIGSTLTATGIAQQNVQYIPTGVLLEVTPKISPDGRVTMRVVPQVSSLGATLQLGGGIQAPIFNTQTIQTTVTVQDGETVALGGLITTNNTKNENKIPYLGDLPGVGALFRFRTQSKSKQELLVILTPHVVRNRLDADRMLALEARRMDWVLSDVINAHGTTGFEPLLPGEPSPLLSPTAPLIPGLSSDPAMPSGTPLVPGDSPLPLPRALPTEKSNGATPPPPAPPVPETQGKAPTGGVIEHANHVVPVETAGTAAEAQKPKERERWRLLPRK